MQHQLFKGNKILYVLAIIVLASWNIPTSLESNTSAESTNENIEETRKKIYKGTATYYHNKFHGRKTASGERYNKKKYTAAVRMNKIKVPFGTMIEVTNMQNKKSVRVKVNDKMSNRASSIVDLSRKAAKEIGLIDAGRAKVEVRVLSEKDLDGYQIE